MPIYAIGWRKLPCLPCGGHAPVIDRLPDQARATRNCDCLRAIVRAELRAEVAPTDRRHVPNRWHARQRR